MKAGLSQEMLANLANVHPTYIGQVERGEKNVTIVVLNKITNALGITLSDVFEHIDGETSSDGESALADGQSTSDQTIPNECYSMIVSVDEKDQRIIRNVIYAIVNTEK